MAVTGRDERSTERFSSRHSFAKAGIVGALFAGAIVASLLLAELVLRVVPIPGISYHSFMYDDVTGQRFYPKTTVIYRSARGEVVRRRVNSWGYLDSDHMVEKPTGVVRIGFFGDSFVEARQVPLNETFHKLVEKKLNAGANGTRYECVAIAMMGYGTLQCELESKRWAKRLWLDDIVYVFCENDPGNHIPAVNRSDAVPYPYLTGDSVGIDWSFRQRYHHKSEWPHRAWQYVKSHSLVFSTLETRLRILKTHGVKTRLSEDERLMAARPAEGKLPEAISPPSTWPDSLRVLAGDLTARVIAAWNREARRDGARFHVVYIPRPKEMQKDRDVQDSWAAWLHRVCEEEGIDLIDPTKRFVEAERGGTEIFYDHLAAGGHAVLAEELARRFAGSSRIDDRP
jgi:hypothetical protein